MRGDVSTAGYRPFVAEVVSGAVNYRFNLRLPSGTFTVIRGPELFVVEGSVYSPSIFDNDARSFCVHSPAGPPRYQVAPEVALGKGRHINEGRPGGVGGPWSPVRQREPWLRFVFTVVGMVTSVSQASVYGT